MDNVSRALLKSQLDRELDYLRMMVSRARVPESVRRIEKRITTNVNKQREHGFR